MLDMCNNKNNRRTHFNETLLRGTCPTQVPNPLGDGSGMH